MTATRRARLLAMSLALLPVTLAGCGGGGADGAMMTNLPGTFSSPATVAGIASKGPFVGASLSFYAVSAQGLRGGLLARAQTGQNGEFSTPLAMPATGPVWVECQVRQHRDEATQQMMSMPRMETVTFCIPEVRPSGTTTAPLTPFNHMAFRLAMRTGGVSTARMRAAMAVLSAAAGTDVSDALPADLSTADRVGAAFAGSGDRARLAHGMLLAGMSRRARELDMDGVQYMLRLGSDFEDGRLDGRTAGGAPVPGMGGSEMAEIRDGASTFATEREPAVRTEPGAAVRLADVLGTIRGGGDPIADVPAMSAMPVGMPGDMSSMPGGMPPTMPVGMPGDMGSMPGGMPPTMPVGMPGDMGSMPGGMPMTMPAGMPGDMGSMPGGMPPTMPVGMPGGMGSMPGGMPMAMPRGMSN